MKRWILLVSLSLWAAAAAAEPLDAVVRITRQSEAGQTIGSGTVIGEIDGKLAILTNAHVAGSRPGGQVAVEFFARGYESGKLAGETVWASYSGGTPPKYAPRDVAIVEVPKASLGRFWTDAVDVFAPWSAEVPMVTSAGCPRGDWPNQFQGHPTKIDRLGLIEFVPEAVPGRSGSPLFAPDNKTMLGVITWADPESGVGIAQSMESIRNFMAGTPPRNWAAWKPPANEWRAAGEYRTLPVRIPRLNVSTDGRTAPMLDVQPPTAYTAFPGLARLVERSAKDVQCGPGKQCPNPNQPGRPNEPYDYPPGMPPSEPGPWGLRPQPPQDQQPGPGFGGRPLQGQSPWDWAWQGAIVIVGLYLVWKVFLAPVIPRIRIDPPKT